MKKQLCFFLLLLFYQFSPGNLFASERYYDNITQDRPVTGTVYDSKGNPLADVSVVIKGTTTGISTDKDGNFRINVPNNEAVLVFSFVGFTSQEIKVGTRSKITVTLIETDKSLGEVVVVGYGTQKKVNLTGAVSSVTIDEKIADRAVTNMSSALSGLLPGLAVQQSSSMAGGSSAKILIRGMTSPTSPTDPLIVVDGIPDVDINRININDVESISTLKDAAAAAVYGSRASGGVILITTKTGKGLKKPQIKYTGTIGTAEPTRFYNLLQDYPMALTLEQQAATNGRTLPKFYDGTIDEWLSQGMVNPTLFPSVNPMDYVTRTSRIINNSISAAGSNENGNYFVSAGIYDEKGYLINNDFRRYNIRLNLDYKIRKNITIGARTDGQWTNQTFGLQYGIVDYSNGNNPLIFSITGMLPYNEETKQYGGAMAYGEANNAFNLLAEINCRHNLIQRQEFNGNLYGIWTPLPGLNARIDYSLRYYNQFSKNYTDLGVSLYNFQTGSSVNDLFLTSGTLSNGSNQGYKTMLQAKLDYTKKLFKNHQLYAMVVYAEEYWLDRGFAAWAGGRQDERITELVNNSANSGTLNLSGSSSDEGLRSVIGRINYTINDKYLFEANMRADGSSLFSPGHQWGYFPSVSAGWRFSDEDFFNSLKGTISSGKLRISYGSIGNNKGVNRYEQLQTFRSGGYILNGNTMVPGLSANKQINEDFTWEKTTVANLGLDLGFFNNKLTAEIDIYDKVTTNLIRPMSISTLLTGYDPPRTNIGTYRNDGIELTLGWRSRISDFNYGITFNCAYNRDRVEEWSQLLNPGKPFLEMPYNFVYMYQSRGIAQTWEDIYNAPYQNNANTSPGDLLYNDVNGDGQVTAYDRKALPAINQVYPAFNFGSNLYASYKGFDVSVLLQGSAGRKDFFIESMTSPNVNANRFAFQKLYLTDFWNLENRYTLYPRMVSGSTANNTWESDFWLQSMSYLRFKNIQIGYNIPGKVLRRAGIDRIRIYATAENLFTITKWKGVDPEKSTTGNGFINNSYTVDDPMPILRSYSIGINIDL